MTPRELFALRIALARRLDPLAGLLRALEPVLGGTNPNAVPRYFH